MRGVILVVDDEPLKRITLQIELSEHGYEVYEAADAGAARRIFDSKPIDVVVSDVRMPGLSGLDLLPRLRQARPEVEVILMTAYATVDTAVLAIKRGAHDYITKPFTTQQLIEKLDRLFATRKPPETRAGVETLGRMEACSASMKRLFAQIRALAGNDRAILLCGESGAGKELAAEAIHELSPRRDKPLLVLRCGAAPGALEHELFGQAQGAGRSRAGRLELAAGGTLLLDEVDQVPLALQGRLLRVIEHQEIERAAGDEPLRVDTRLICATKRDLAPLLRDGQFREDLYYRLNTLSLTIPPLRERPDDIPLLARCFAQKHAALADGRCVRISADALDELLRYPWPGNVRELEHVMERALAFCAGDAILPEHVLPLSREADASTAGLLELPECSRGLNETVSDIEKRLIRMALRQCNGNQARAAQRLGIPRTTLRDKMSKYSIPTE